MFNLFTPASKSETGMAIKPAPVMYPSVRPVLFRESKRSKSAKPGKSKKKSSLRLRSSSSVDRRVSKFRTSGPHHQFIKNRPWLKFPATELKSTISSSVRVSDLIYPAADTSMASSFVSMNQVYRFRLGGYAVVDSTTGVINAFVSADPSAAGVNFPEWSSLSALFNEFKLVSLSVQFQMGPWAMPATWGVSSIGPPNLMIASDLNLASNPGSYAALADNADSTMISPRLSATHGYTHTLHGTELGWSQVATPTITPYAGAPGSVQFYGGFGTTTQTSCLQLLITGIYDFRSRT